jgi:hypothetical protein
MNVDAREIHKKFALPKLSRNIRARSVGRQPEVPLLFLSAELFCRKIPYEELSWES